MQIANEYNHLNAREFLLVNREAQYNEILQSIKNIDANQFLKISCDKSKLGKVFYSQSDINRAIKTALYAEGWKERRIEYYVTADERITREIINITNKEKQKEHLNKEGVVYYSTFNQVDFQKERVAVEVQFGKYFSVAYDLHVKHTFFYSRNDIDVGIEVIPTKAMEEHMDTGVPWYENEVTNVIREGRTNPPVPILILGIEPEMILSNEPIDFTDEDLINILKNSNWTIVNKVDTIYKEKCRVQLLSAVPSTILLFHLVSSFRENYAVSWHYRILRCIRTQITGVPAENDMFYG